MAKKTGWKSDPAYGWLMNNQNEYELMYNDISKEFLARIEELSDHILDLEQILFDNDLPILNDHIEL